MPEEQRGSQLLAVCSALLAGCGGPAGSGTAGAGSNTASTGGEPTGSATALTSSTAATSGGGNVDGSTGTDASGTSSTGSGTTTGTGGGTGAGGGPAETFPSGFGEPEVLSTSLTKPTRLGMHAGWLYFTEMGLRDGSASRLARWNDGEEQTLFEGRIVAPLHFDGDDLFFAERGEKRVFRMSTATLEPQVFATTPLAVGDIVRDGNRIWMTMYDLEGSGALSIFAVYDRASGELLESSTASSTSYIFTYLVAAGGWIYVTTQPLTSATVPGLLKASPVAGPASLAVAANGVESGFISATPSHVYFGSRGGGHVLRQAHAVADQPEAVATGQPAPFGVWVDSGGVYFTNEADCMTATGSVRGLPVAGGDVVTLAAGRGCPSAVVSDAGSVYWSEWLSGHGDVAGQDQIVRVRKVP